MKVRVGHLNEVFARTTPHGFWRFGANYFLAADLLITKIHDEGQLFFPVLQLYGIAIELSLKAFLLKRGLTVREIREPSHDLSKVLIMARRRKLGREVKLDPREVAAIEVLNINYSTNRLRYIVTGATKTPELVYIERAARKLVMGLEYFCTGAKGRLAHVA
jgi:hypothetical protein